MADAWRTEARHDRRASTAGQVLAALVGLASALLAGWLALHHPLTPLLALAGVAVLGAAQAAWPPLWLIALPALLPWLGLGAWSGWLVAEEMDLAILAVAAGAYLRWAVQPGQRVRAGQDSRRLRTRGQLLLLVWTASVLVAMQRGALDAGGWSWTWWQGLREPLNALRLAKPTFAVLLLLPLWWRLQQRPGQRCADQLGWGMTAMLAGVALWCIYERLAFTGLLDMSTEYRTSGPFWETQIGGASLDVSLALALPFALRLAWTARQPLAVAAAGLVVLAGVYAGLTSFSRILYLALPAGAVVLWVLHRRQNRAGPPAGSRSADLPARGRVRSAVMALAWTGLACLAAGLVVLVFDGDSFMGDRMKQSEADGAARWQHFQDGLALNDRGLALWIGRGLGRYPDLYALHGRLENRQGDIRLVEADTGPVMRLAAGNHILGHGELLRLSQRVAGVPGTGLRVTVQMRAPAAAALAVDLCDKHLLYDTACRSVALRSAAGTTGWQTLTAPLPDAGPDAAPLPRIVVLSVASETRVPIDLRSVALTDGSGRSWLANPDFADGGARWFITSSRLHLAWHAQNIAVHLVVEQGLLGLAALLAVTVAGLVAVVGPLRRHPLAPPLAAAIVGAWIVGGVDSVLDMPRIATWLLLLTAMALQLHLPSRARQPRTR